MSPAAAKQVTMDAALAAVLSKQHYIFALKAIKNI